jgi:hypothetical protein
VEWSVAVSFVSAAAAVLEHNLLGLFQNFLGFSEVKHSVICLYLNVHGDGDGVVNLAGFGSEFLVRVVSWVSLSHLGRHEVSSAAKGI